MDLEKFELYLNDNFIGLVRGVNYTVEKREEYCHILHKSIFTKTIFIYNFDGSVCYCLSSCSSITVDKEEDYYQVNMKGIYSNE